MSVPAAQPRASGVPEGYHTVTPFVIVNGAAEFIEFTKQAFGAEEMGRVNGPDGSISHAEVRIGDSVVMPFDSKARWPNTPAFLLLSEH
jgi:PhnB protein